MRRDFWNMVNNRQKISHNILTNTMVRIESQDGKNLIVIEVPRAERTVRPVFKGMDPRTGTYRRWHEGDHLCSMEEVGAMLRDASISPQDATPVKEMDMTVFCQESINGYRNVFKASNPNHLWNQLDNELFLRRIKAVAVGDDGCYHPTEAGLLMFGYEYEITNRFPLYFLDYQEDRELIGSTRWKDRIVSSSGDWSGNLFDFTFKVLPKLQADLKVPFVLRGSRRVDDTPVHKLLREAVVNTLSNADYWGRQGVVISKGPEGFTFANPGRFRIPVSEAVGGGVSDPRNATILKFFSLIRFGERAGSGLNGIFHVWRKVYHSDASIRESEGEVDRTVLSLPFNGQEQDVKAMLTLYDETMIATPHDSQEESAINPRIGDKSAIKALIDRKSAINPRIGDKSAITDHVKDVLAEILEYLEHSGEHKTQDIAAYIGKGPSRTKDYIQLLLEMELVVAKGSNRNRVYGLNRNR